MLHLNLTAEEAKQTFRLQRLHIFLIETEIFLLSLVILAGIITWAAQKTLTLDVYRSSQETSKLINANSADYNSKVREINQRMATVAQIENGFVSYAKILRSLSLLIPGNISLSYVNIDSDTETIKIRGLALTRDNLLDLEKSLQSAPWFSNVNLPLEQKLNKININFDIDIKFDTAKIPD